MANYRPWEPLAQSPVLLYTPMVNKGFLATVASLGLLIGGAQTAQACQACTPVQAGQQSNANANYASPTASSSTNISASPSGFASGSAITNQVVYDTDGKSEFSTTVNFVGGGSVRFEATCGNSSVGLAGLGQNQGSSTWGTLVSFQATHVFNHVRCSEGQRRAQCVADLSLPAGTVDPGDFKRRCGSLGYRLQAAPQTAAPPSPSLGSATAISVETPAPAAGPQVPQRLRQRF